MNKRVIAIQNDTLSILLSNRIHSALNVKQRALKIAKTCKIIRDKTKDNVLYNACRSIIKATSTGAYSDVVKSIELTELNYFKEYHDSL